MSSTHAESTQATSGAIHANRLFTASCLSLISTSVAFAVVGDIMNALKTQFILTNQQVGWIGGAALWGFTLSIIVLGPLCDVLGMRNLLRFSFLCHLAGPLIMMFAPGFTLLFVGALVIALGNGTVEAACNPLVATLYPNNKTTKLNQFHVWFPGGIVLGCLACFLLSMIGISSWKLRLGLILLPTLVYGFLFLGQKFPLTERVQSGVSFGGMIAATLTRPLFIVLFLCMGLTASLELGPNRWITSILQSGGMHGILVLAWISGLMAVLRFFAGPIIHRLSSTGVLLGSSVLAGLGLFGLSYANTMTVALATATVFAFGVCYFWPTMLGVVAERVPKGGALALAMMGGMGMLASGMIASPQLGRIADNHLLERLDTTRTLSVLEAAAVQLPKIQAAAPEAQRKDFDPFFADVTNALALTAKNAGALTPDTAKALRAIIGAASSVPKADDATKKLLGDTTSLLGPADNYGGRMAFRIFAPFALILVVVFSILFVRDRMTARRPA